jgi:predicted nucleotidyltransferase
VEYFELDLVAVASELAARVSNVSSVRLFGSRKYPGKVRSDLDLLVFGPTNLSSLLDFRNRFNRYEPLDLWLVSGDSATSAVNGSSLQIRDLHTIELYPRVDEKFSQQLRVQRFRADIAYALTSIPRDMTTQVRDDHLGLSARNPRLLDTNLVITAEAIVDVLRNALDALKRMRNDGHARRGSGTLPTLATEYDLQNLTEMVLAPVLPLEREPFAVTCQGKKRTADFSFASGRVILELKFAKSSGELGSAVKNTHGILTCYLNHPGVEVALAILGVSPSASADKNRLESWTETRGQRQAIVRVLTIPEETLTAP